MVKIVIDAGHGANTPGKRSPSDEREWTFNNKVALAAIDRLNQYEGVQILRVDDPTGKTDVPLLTRTNRANAFKGDAYVSLHHNAMTGVWGSHGGIETFTYNGINADARSITLAGYVHKRVVRAMGLRDRGVKKANFHVLRLSKMPAILVEGGFMDSTTDIIPMRNDTKLKEQGYAVADGIADYFKLSVKVGTVPPGGSHVVPGGNTSKPSTKLYRLSTGTFATKADAQKAATAIKKQFGWIVHIDEV